MRPLNKKTIINSSASQNVFSEPFNTDQTFACSAQLIASGNVLGNFKIQTSDDSVTRDFPQNWEDVPDTSMAITGAGLYLIPKTDIAGQYHRLVFIDCSNGTSTGTITCNIFTHGF